VIDETETSPRGRRIEELYFLGLKIPSHQREAFILEHAGDDPEAAKRLRDLFLLPNPFAADPLAAANGDATTSNSYELEIGALFGRCRIEYPIGAGGMGAVYAAADLRHDGRKVALKVMKPAMLTQIDLHRFDNEVSALSRLEHPNIARLYYGGIDRWRDADRPYYVM
jgi:hypothetical protein